MSKSLEAFEDLTSNYPNNYSESYQIVLKELKALEIIKPLVDLSKGQQHCWLWLGMNGMQITEEEYNLLKEVLDNE